MLCPEMPKGSALEVAQKFGTDCGAQGPAQARHRPAGMLPSQRPDAAPDRDKNNLAAGRADFDDLFDLDRLTLGRYRLAC